MALRKEFSELGITGQAGVNRGNDIAQGNPPMLRKHLGDNTIDSVAWVRFKLNRIDEHSENYSSLLVELTICTHSKSLRTSRSHNLNRSTPLVVIARKCETRDIFRREHSDDKNGAAQGAGHCVLRGDRSIASESR